MPSVSRPRPIALSSRRMTDEAASAHANYLKLFERYHGETRTSRAETLEMEIEIKRYELEQYRANNVVNVHAKRARKNAARHALKLMRSVGLDPDNFCIYDPNMSARVASAAADIARLHN